MKTPIKHRDQTYMTRALKARDPRYARVLERLGYGAPRSAKKEAKEMDAEAAHEELTRLRSTYQEVVGKKAFNGWDATELRTRIAEFGANEGGGE